MIFNMDCISGAKQHLQDDSIDLLIADPPYNLGFGGTNMTKNKKPRFSIIANDRLHPRDYQRFTFQWLREAYRVLKPGRHIYVFIDWRMYPLLYLWMQRVGFTIKNCLAGTKYTWEWAGNFAISMNSSSSLSRVRIRPVVFRIVVLPTSGQYQK